MKLSGKKESQMVYEISIKPWAEDDTEIAYNWYEDQKEGLGEEFLAELVVFYKKLEHNPAAFKKIKRNYRQVALKRFPYVMVLRLSNRKLLFTQYFTQAEIRRTS